MMASLNEAHAKTAADEFRRKHGLGIQPLGDLAVLIEQTTGCEVAILEAEAREHGLMMRDPLRDKVFIGVANTRNPMRQRSTLAHELAHLVFQDSVEDIVERSPVETRANAFARHLLVPQEGVTQFLGDVDACSEAALSEVVQKFLVSPAMAAIAMREAGYVPEDVVKKWMKIHTPQLATRFGWSDFYTALQKESEQVRAPQRLLARSIAGYAEGVVSARAVAGVRGVPVETVVAELDGIGINPKEIDPSHFEPEEPPNVNIDLSALDGEGDSL